jgi:hypothetical protein
MMTREEWLGLAQWWAQLADLMRANRYPLRYISRAQNSSFAMWCKAQEATE